VPQGAVSLWQCRRAPRPSGRSPESAAVGW
jgi:hypothetical protein